MQLALYQTDTHIYTLDIVITYIATYMSLSLPILQRECSMVQLQQHCTHTLGFKTGIQNLCCTYTILYELGDYCPCVSAPFRACTQWLHQRVQLSSSATNPHTHVHMHPCTCTHPLQVQDCYLSKQPNKPVLNPLSLHAIYYTTSNSNLCWYINICTWLSIWNGIHYI